MTQSDQRAGVVERWNEMCDGEFYEVVMAADYDRTYSALERAERERDEARAELTKFVKLDAFLKDDGDVSASVYESAVKGRQDFRNAFRMERARADAALARVGELEGCLDGKHKITTAMQAQVDAQRAECARLRKALNRIAILGSGADAYTSKFTTEVCGIAREALTK